jgi:hypothetical protein
VGRSPNLFRTASSVSRSTEVRWFIRGQGPQLPTGARSFIDHYSSELLASSISAKLRQGDAAGAFLKTRTAVHPPVDFGGLEGIPETWLRLETEWIPWDPSGERFAVRKEVFRHHGIEVAHLEFGNEVWWSLALRARDAKFPGVPREIVHHIQSSGTAVVSCSYPTWLLSVRTPGSQWAPSMRSASERPSREADARPLEDRPSAPRPISQGTPA